MLYNGAQKINKRLKPEPRESVLVDEELLVFLRQHTLSAMEAPQATAVASQQQAEDAGLMKRIQIFVEAIVKMVSTVFLAACVSLAKVEMRDHSLVRGFLTGMAGCTLVFAILSLVLITLPNRFPEKLYHRSMFFIHCCGVLLMVVAYLTIRLISKDDHNRAWLGLLALFATVTVIWWSVSHFKGHARCAFQNSVHQEHLDKLENWVDFLAAITVLLFLGLGALLIGGQYRTLQILPKNKEAEVMLLPLFKVIISLSILICMAGVFFMLVCIVLVPPISDGICYILHIVNYVFGGALALIVLLVTLGKMGTCWYAPTLAFLLSIFPSMLWLVLVHHYGAIRRRDQEVTPMCRVSLFCKKCIVFLCGFIGSRGDDEVKPASLDLTKVTCTGFLAISAYTISQNTPVSIGNSYSWFIFFTAIAVNNFIWWRLFTHHKKPSEARFTAANTAFLCANVYAIAAVFPFGFMIYHAFNKNTSSAPSGHAPNPAAS